MAIKRNSHKGGYSSSSQISNVAGYGSSEPRRPRHSARNRTANGSGPRHSKGGNPRPSSRQEQGGFLDKGVVSIPTNNGEVLLTRRHFLYGAAGVGVLAAASAGIKAYSSSKSADNTLNVLSVPKDAVTESTSLTELENGGKLYLSANLELPYGTLMWANDDYYAALLLPTETGSPLTSVGLLRLSSGYYFTVLNQAIGLAEGFEIYDVRTSSEGMVWTEVDILEGVWRIYGAQLVDAVVTNPRILDTGNSDWETPSIAICGTEAFWQVLPNLDGPKKTEASTLRCASVLGASSEYQVLLTSNGRMCTPIYASDNQITVTPRADADGVYYQLTAIDAATKSIVDTMVLPQSMKPLEAGYGKTGFMFSFEGIYSYGDGIANLGTYAPKEDARQANPSAVPWFHFARTPSAPPCWCGDYLIVKSTRSVVCIDLESDTYFLFDSESGAENYGDYLASTGLRQRVLIFTNINEETLTGGTNQHCSVRIYTAPSAQPDPEPEPEPEEESEEEESEE